MSRREPGSARRGPRAALPGYWAPVIVGFAVGLAIGFAFANLPLGVAAAITVGSALAWEQRHSTRRS